MKAIQHLLTGSLHLYKLAISPALHLLFGPTAGCRFEPTCSVYAIEAISRHGSCRGSWLACCRVFRCHPWGGCGCDPVPPARAAAAKTCFSDAATAAAPSK